MRTFLLVLAASGLAGCGDVPNSFVSSSKAHDPTYLRWTQDGEKIEGTLFYVETEDFEAESKSYPFKGTIDGEEVIITVSALAGLAEVAMSGNLDGDKLILQTDDGKQVLVEGTKQDFDSQFRKLRKRLVHDRDDAEKSEAEAEAAEAESKARGAIDKRVEGLRTDLQTLASAPLRGSSADYAANVRAATGNHATARDHFNGVRPSEDGDCEYAVSEVEYDVSSLEYDLSSWDYSRGVSERFTTPLSDTIASVSSGHASIEADASALDYEPSSVPTDAEVATAVSHARQAIQREAARKIDAKKRIDSMLSEARAWASQAAAKC